MKLYLASFIFLISICSFSQNKVTDVSGNIYKTVKIGTQIWMAENLSVSTFRNGDPIREITSYEEWLSANNSGKPAWCYYEFNSKNSGFGKLYNWFAVNDPRGLAPKGYHIPKDSEWTLLENFLNKNGTACNELKSVTGWVDMNGNNISGTNDSGFNSIPSGALYADGNFVSLGEEAYYWTSTVEDDVTSWYRYVNETITRAWNFHYAHLSIRCIKD